MPSDTGGRDFLLMRGRSEAAKRGQKSARRLFMLFYCGGRFMHIDRASPRMRC